MAFRNIGCGLEAMTAFSMMMNMQKAMTRDNYTNLINNIHSTYLEEADASMKLAADEEKSQSESSDITASFDGTWQKPGHASLNGVVSAVSNLSGKVIDYQVKSKYCKACQRKNHLNRESLACLQWQIRHQSKCNINHKGSSGAMEVDGYLIEEDLIEHDALQSAKEMLLSLTNQKDNSEKGTRRGKPKSQKSNARLFKCLNIALKQAHPLLSKNPVI